VLTVGQRVAEVRRELAVCWVLSFVSRLWSVYRTVYCCDVLTVGQRVEEVRRELPVCWVLSLVSRLWSVYRTVHCWLT